MIRHGETDWNASHFAQGQSDVPLNETGRSQARALHDTLRTVPFTAVYASPLLRARETAEILFPGRDLTFDPELMEANAGVWEGRNTRMIEEERPDEWALWRDTLNFAPERGETRAQQYERAGRFLRRFEREWLMVEGSDMRKDESAYASVRIAVVAHGAILRAMTGAFLELPMLFRHLSFENCGYTQLRYRRDMWRLIRVNAT